VPLLLCLAEEDRTGRYAGLDESLLHEIVARVGTRFSDGSAVIKEGRIGGVKALASARQLMTRDRQVERVLVCGVDSLLVAGTLSHYHAQRRLLTVDNSDGFIPGEGACAVVVAPSAAEPSATIAVTGIGFGNEPAPIGSGVPLRADGLTTAIKQAMNDARVDSPQLAYRLTDNSGEQYGFKETALAMARTLSSLKPEFDILHPADCFGEIGAATVPALLAVANAAERKGYAPGRFMGDAVLCQIGSDDGDRAAFIVRSLAVLRAETAAA
jgi:3-oxoacyl-[acyl-carrier-protein] synthase-1